MNRILTLLAFVTFSSGLFIRSADPIILQIATGLNVDPATAALLSTAFALPYALIQPVLGVLADMFSKARLMLICLAVVALASVACALAPNFETLLIARVIAGLGAGGMMPIILALIGDLVPVAGRQVAISRILFAVMSGILIGSFGAGALADLFDWRTVFAVMAGMGFVVLAIAVPGLRNVGNAGGRFDLSTIGPNYRAIFSNPLAKYCYGAVLVEGAFLYGVFPHMASLLHATGETRASIAGLVIAAFGAGGGLYVLLVGVMLKHAGEQSMMRVGGVVMGLGLLVIAANASWPIEVVNFLVIGLAFYVMHGVLQIHASELAPAARGSAVALFAFFYFLGQAAGPAIYGAAFAISGPAPMLIVGALVLAASGLICGAKLRRPAPKISE